MNNLQNLTTVKKAYDEAVEELEICQRKKRESYTKYKKLAIALCRTAATFDELNATIELLPEEISRDRDALTKDRASELINELILKSSKYHQFLSISKKIHCDTNYECGGKLLIKWIPVTKTLEAATEVIKCLSRWGFREEIAKILSKNKGFVNSFLNDVKIDALRLRTEEKICCVQYVISLSPIEVPLWADEIILEILPDYQQRGSYYYGYQCRHVVESFLKLFPKSKSSQLIT